LELARDTDAASRAVAIESLMGLRITHPDAMSVYVAGLADTNAAVRLAAANALAQAVHKASNATNALAALKKNDPEEAVRFAAAVALEKIAVFHRPQTIAP
jgi:HEAT repeat protein